jgi:uncharacterized membrane protein
MLIVLRFNVGWPRWLTRRASVRNGPASRALNRLPLVSGSRVADVLRSAVWLVPALCVAGAVGLAVVLIVVDAELRPSGGVLLFPGPPAGARSFLSAIVQAMISFTAVVFSITIVVLQLSSSQFSPRVLRHFMRDRIIQSSLGVFVATFTYAMVVLRAVQGGSGTSQANFVPRLAVTGAFALVLMSVALFIAYIAHVVNMIRVATIIASIAADTRTALSAPDDGRTCAHDAAARPPRGTVPSPRPGVLVSLSRRRLVSLAAERGCVLRLAVRIGDYLPEGGDLFQVHGGPEQGGTERRGPDGDGRDHDDEREWRDALYRHVAFDTERTMEQDAAFGFRQLVDIALQALSPAVNAPTTAVQAIDEMHDLLRRLVTRRPPGGCYEDDDGKLRLVVPQYEVADYLRLAIEEIWHHGHDSPQVPGRLHQMLDDLHAVARPEHRSAVEAWRARLREPGPAA